MAIYRVSMSFPYDSTLPKDVVTVNPHYNATDPDALLQALKTNLIATSYVSNHPFTLKAYDAAKAPPSFPLATVTQNGTAPSTSIPREIAICLSYYTTYNRPRFRGRLYLPAVWFTTAPAGRPTGTIMSGVLGFAQNVLTKSLPAQANWVVWSNVEKKAQGGVSDIWCDDEWDTMRSRGLKAVTRQTATI